MKDETCDVPIKGFVKLKSKMYTFVTEENHESKKAKGINKDIVGDELKYEDYISNLFNGSYMRHEINSIRNKDHDMGSYTINRNSSLSSYDDKKTYT